MRENGDSGISDLSAKPTDNFPRENKGTKTQVVDEATYHMDENSPISYSGFGEHHEFTEFKIVKVIGKGGMGLVYEAIDLELNRRVALKVLPPSSLQGDQQVARFKNEARAVARLSHDSIVPVYRVGTDNGIHFYAMKLIEGRNLSDVIRNARDYISEAQPVKNDTLNREKSRTQGAKQPSEHATSDSKNSNRFSGEHFKLALSSRRGHGGHELYLEIAKLGANIADGLSHAHQQGVIHRDIKPSNILMDNDGKPWITDFGLAQVRDCPNATQTGDVLGTLHYMSPEQASGRRFLVDHRTDVYSLGVTLYELISLKKPFQAKDARELIRQVTFEEPKPLRAINPAVPEDLEIIVTKAISKNPHERYETALDFSEDLLRFASGIPIRAKRASVGTKVRRWFGRHQALAATGGIIIVMTLLISLGSSGVIWSALVSEKEARIHAEDLLRLSEGLRLSGQSSLQISKNPGLATVLSLESSKYAATPEIQSATLAALEANHERRTIFLRDPRPKQVGLSSDGKLAVCVGASGAAAVVESETGFNVCELNEHGKISRAFFHPTRNQLLTSPPIPSETKPAQPKSTSLVSLWELGESPKQIQFRESQPTYLQPSSFSSNGDLVVLPMKEKEVGIYQTWDGHPSVVFRGHEAPVLAAVFSADNNLVTSSDASGVICVWKASDGSLLHKFLGKGSFYGPIELAFSRDSQLLILSNQSGTFAYSLQKNIGEPIWQSKDRSFEINPKFNRIASFQRYSKTLVVRNISDGSVAYEHSFSSPITCARYFGDGRRLAVSLDRSISVVDDTFGNVLVKLAGHTDRISDFAIGNEGRTLVSVASDGTARNWSYLTPMERKRIPTETWSDLPTRLNLAHMPGSIATCSGKNNITITTRFDSDKFENAIDGEFRNPIFESSNLVTFDGTKALVTDITTSRKIADTSLGGVNIVDAHPIPGRNLVLLALQNSHLVLWNFENQSHCDLTNTGNRCTAWNVSPDGKELALGFENGLCRILSTDDQSFVREWKLASAVNTILYLDEGEILTLDSQRTISRFEKNATKPDLIFGSDGDAFAKLAYNAKLNIVVAYSLYKPGKICSWNFMTGERLHSHEVTDLAAFALHPTLSQVALASPEDTTKIWDPSTGEIQEVAPANAVDVAFHSNQLLIAHPGKQIRSPAYPVDASQTNGPSLFLFDLEKREIARTLKLPFEPNKLSIDAARGDIAISSFSWSVVIGDFRRNSMERSRPYSAPVSVVQYCANQNLLLVGANNGQVSILDSKGNSLHELLPEGEPISAGAVSPDDKLFATGDWGGNIRIWDIASRAEVQTFKTQDSPILSLEFDSSGIALIAACSDEKIRRWDLRTKTEQSLPIPHGVHAVRLARKKDVGLVVAGKDLWETIDNNQRRTALRMNVDMGPASILDLSKFQLHSIPIPEVAVAGAINFDGSMAAIASQEGTISIVNVAERKTLFSFDCLPRKIAGLQFSNDGRLLSVLHDQGISLWDMVSSEWTMQLPESNKPWKALSSPYRHEWSPFFNGDSELLSFDSWIQFFPVNPAIWAEAESPRSLTQDESRIFRLDGFTKRK